jgi:glycosyltransferase involved in cell wall biosynthesis
MKVIQLVTRDVIGGVQTVADVLDAGLRANSEDTAVWFFCGSEEETIPTPNSVCIFPRRPGISYYFRLLWRLYLRFLRERPDAIIAHTTNTAVPGLILARLAGIHKRIVVQHNPFDSYSKLAKAADRLCAETGTYTVNVSTSNAVSRTMTGYSRSAMAKVTLLYNGMPSAYPGRSLPAPERNQLLHRFDLPEDVPIILTVGRLAEQKNQSVLIEAMRTIKIAVLVIAGSGPLQADLSRQINTFGLQKSVRLIGPISLIDMRLLMQVATFFVTSATFEAMPMTLVEALQFAVPILASDIPAHTEMLAEAAMTAPADPASFADAMRALLADPDTRARLSAAALQRSTTFSKEAMVRGYMNVLER